MYEYLLIKKEVVENVVCIWKSPKRKTNSNDSECKEYVDSSIEPLIL